MYKRFLVEIIDKSNLKSFFSNYKPTFDLPNSEEIFNRTTELAYDNEDILATNVIHACYDLEEEKYCAIMNLGTTTAVDDLVSIDVEFLFIEKEYRKNELEGIDSKLSKYLLQDYLIGEVAINIQKNIGINYIAIAPLNDKIRSVYEDYGYESILREKDDFYEDWMVFTI